MRTIDKIILHHSGDYTSNDSNGIRLYELTINPVHLRQRGINSKAEYHYIIARDGHVYQCAPDSDILGHCWVGSDRVNLESIGICFEGNMESQTLTFKQENEGIGMIEKLCRAYKIKPENIFLHKDFVNTDCPGKYFPWPRMKKTIQTDLTTKPKKIFFKIGSNEVQFGWTGSMYETKKMSCPAFISIASSWVHYKGLDSIGFDTKKLANHNGNVKLATFALANGYTIEWLPRSREVVLRQPTFYKGE